MNKNDLGKIKAVDWFHYLTRAMNIFSFICNAKAYKKIKYVGKIKNVGYLYEKELVRFYRDKNEFSKNIRLLQENIINNPKKIEEELLIGIKLNEKAKNIIEKFNKNRISKPNKKDLIKLVHFYIDLFTYSTVFPYLIGLSVEKYKIRNKRIMKIVSRLRLVSHFSDFFLIVLEKYFLMFLGEKNIKNVSISDYTPDELLLFLKTGNLRKIKRKYFYYFHLGEGEMVGNDKRTFDHIKKIIDPELDVSGQKIKGLTAHSGLVRGYVKIVYSPKDFRKFDRGDILVTINSNPSLMPVIKKSKAIIADEGGIICHAAIISRELKIPCIIGTKIATKVLRDGDLVEVDANRGIVKIIKRVK